MLYYDILYYSRIEYSMYSMVFRIYCTFLCYVKLYHISFFVLYNEIKHQILLYYIIFVVLYCTVCHIMVYVLCCISLYYVVSF